MGSAGNLSGPRDLLLTMFSAMLPPPPVVISRVAGEESENRAFSTSGPAKYPLSACQGSEMH